MKPLTDAQHRALGRSRSKSGVPVSGPRVQPNGKRAIPEGHVSHQLANVLIDGGFAQLVEGALRITHAGEREFTRVRPEGPGLFLDINPARPPTHSLIRAAREEPEMMPAELLRPDWRLRAEAHRKLSRQDLDGARLSGLDHSDERLAELRRMAVERGQDVQSEVKRVELTRKAHERAVRALERKVIDCAA
jgi:hypothetical protein